LLKKVFDSMSNSWKFPFLSLHNMDAPERWQIGFQDPATPIAMGIQDLHHDIFFFIIAIVLFVFWMLIRTLWHFHESRNSIPTKIIHGTTLEIVWTLIPSFLLILIAFPSLSLLYSMDQTDQTDPDITLKVIGHQWYWTYEYSDYAEPIQFDSYLIPEEDLEIGQFRLLEVDNRVVLPIHKYIRVLITAADVLHSWAVPSLGVKCDAVPGRLNQVFLYIQREGVFYGQCSELCGVNHGFMPIVVEAVSSEDYANWIINKNA